MHGLTRAFPSCLGGFPLAAGKTYRQNVAFQSDKRGARPLITRRAELVRMDPANCFEGSSVVRRATSIQSGLPEHPLFPVLCEATGGPLARFLGTVLPLHRQKGQIACAAGCRISSAYSYSPRSASIGSVLDARLAGSTEAARAIISIVMAESTRTRGSNGLTSNRKERSKRDAATAPSNPRPQPVAASLAPELRMNRITPERWQPSAMRSAISCSRNATENAITP